MIPAEKVKELVDAHTKLEEPMTGAIWIRRDASAVCLIEILPTMADDDKAEEPTYFNPGIAFRFPLVLFAGNLRSLKEALHRDPKFASEVASGDVVFDNAGDATTLVQLAQSLAQAA